VRKISQDRAPNAKGKLNRDISSPVRNYAACGMRSKFTGTVCDDLSDLAIQRYPEGSVTAAITRGGRDPS